MSNRAISEKELKAKSKNGKNNHNLLNERKNILFKAFTEQNYTLYSINHLKEFIQNKINKTNFGRKGKWILPNDYIENKDYLCSILYYCNNFNDQIKLEDWSQKFYLIFNNLLDNPPSALNYPDKLPEYINFINGYRKNVKTNKNDIISINKENFIKNIKSQGFEYIFCDYENDYYKHTDLRCIKCGKKFNTVLCNGRYLRKIYCPGCSGKSGQSNIENEIFEYIQKLLPNTVILHNDKTLIGKELDIYIPSEKLAIEINGVNWHSFGTTFPNNIHREDKDKTKHYDKYKLCEAKGVKLLQFTDIIINKKLNLVKSIIKDNLGLITKNYDAKKCIIKNIDINIKDNFLEENDLLGTCYSLINLGLYFNKQLLAVATFKSINDSKSELLRFCLKQNIRVDDALDKLIKYYFNNYNAKELTTVVDNTISDGNIFKKLNFKLIDELKIDFQYIDYNHNILPKSSYNKTKIDNKKLRKYYNAGYKIFLLKNLRYFD